MYLFATLGEKIERVTTICDSRTDDREPMEYDRWLISFPRNDLLKTTF